MTTSSLMRGRHRLESEQELRGDVEPGVLGDAPLSARVRDQKGIKGIERVIVETVFCPLIFAVIFTVSHIAASNQTGK